MLEDTPRQEATLDGTLAVLGLAAFFFALANLMSREHMLLAVVAFAPAVGSLYGAFSPAHHRAVLALGVGALFALLALAFATVGAATWRWVGALVLAGAHAGLFLALHAHLPHALQHRVHPPRHRDTSRFQGQSRWRRPA